MADEKLKNFYSMTNVELRAELKRRGCPTSGNKKDLLAKLRAALEKEYEQNTNHHETPVTYTNLPIHDQVKTFYRKAEILFLSLGCCSAFICIQFITCI